MGLDRRDFIRGAGAAAFLASNGTILISLPAQAREGLADPLPRVDPERVIETAAPASLAAQFQSLARWLDDAGWRAAIRDACGIDLDPDHPALDTLLFRPMRVPPVGGFGGLRLIEPGDPAMSFLYHMLASPGLALARNGPPAPPSAYPSLLQIDLLENYIYARLPPEPADRDLMLAMFAYEYRPAHKTPHGKHSDLVFSRTGVARSGNAPARHDPLRRSYVNEPANGGRADVAVTPARYALFLARPVRDPASRIGRESRDRRRRFLIPVRKVYSGCPSIDGAGLRFAESHRDEKLSRLAAVDGLAPPQGLGLDRNRPPFLRHSRSTTVEAGTAPLPGHDSALVELEQVGSSVLVVPQVLDALIQPAKQNDKRLRFRVPPLRGVGPLANRRYSSLKLEEHPVRQGLDLFLSDIVFDNGRTTGFRAPKHAPAFVNIRYVMNATDEAVSHLGPDEGALLDTTDRGGYYAGLFIDGLCDGCVTAHFEPGPRPARPVLPAFSLVAAPDFFPKIDPLDLRHLDGMFLEGGTESASVGRRRANPMIPHPTDVGPAFPIRPRDQDVDVSDTITAVVSATAGLEGPVSGRIGVSGLNTLPDTTSYIFAPGWDMTYSRTPEGATYYATYGLGSPFPEDMKLCAAANGMWPGVSPDAARTFHAGLGGVPSRGGFSRRPQAAVPLLDEELGYHPDSPAATEHGREPSYGWDGEHGPYFEVFEQDGGRRLRVNYPDVARADYVQNVLGGKLDFTRLRTLESEMLIGRMQALQLCIRALPGTERTRFTNHWLISAEEVPEWSEGAQGLGVPRRLFGDTDWARRLPPGADATGGGWLYLFARVRYGGDNAPRARASVDCRDVSVCQVVGERVRWCRISGTAPQPPAAGDWHWSSPAR